MPSYLVETYLARGRAGERAARERRARTAAEELTQERTPVRFERSIYVPEDEICFFVFDAPRAETRRWRRIAPGSTRSASSRRSRPEGGEMKSKWLWALLAVVLGVSVYVGNVLATPSVGPVDHDAREGDGRRPRPQREGDDDRRSAGTASRIRTASGSPGSRRTGSPTSTSSTTSSCPEGRAGWHSHPGPSLIFVVAGTVTNYTSDDPSCTPHVYTAGQSFVDPGGDDMHILRNEDPAVTAETIAVQFLPQGATRRIEEPSPGNCPLLNGARRRAGDGPPSAGVSALYGHGRA